MIKREFIQRIVNAESKLKEIHQIIESILSDPIKNYIGYVGSLKKIEELSK